MNEIKNQYTKKTHNNISPIIKTNTDQNKNLVLIPPSKN